MEYIIKITSSKELEHLINVLKNNGYRRHTGGPQGDFSAIRTITREGEKILIW